MSHNAQSKICPSEMCLSEKCPSKKCRGPDFDNYMKKIFSQILPQTSDVLVDLLVSVGPQSKSGKVASNLLTA